MREKEKVRREVGMGREAGGDGRIGVVLQVSSVGQMS